MTEFKKLIAVGGVSLMHHAFIPLFGFEILGAKIKRLKVVKN